MANLSGAHRVSAWEINNILVDFNLSWTTEDFKEYLDPVPGRDQLGNGSLASTKESGDYRDLVPDLVWMIGDFEDAVRGYKAKFMHYPGRDVDGNFLAPNDVPYATGILDVADVIYRVETSKEITREESFCGKRLCLGGTDGPGKKNLDVVKGVQG